MINFSPFYVTFIDKDVGIIHMKSFKGGVHPSEYKELSRDKSFEEMPSPKQIFVPISQHIGKPAKVTVKKGEEVKRGSVVAEADGFVSVPIHTSIGGKVKTIGAGIVASGLSQEGITINAGETEETETLTPLSIDSVTPEDIRSRIREAGLVGQGGAAFPTSVKLSPPPGVKLDTIILNGCECEPYLTRDYRFMIERPDDVIGGMLLIMKATDVQNGIIGIEDNKPEAIKKMTEAASKYPNIEVAALKTKYPQGAEKVLIKALLDREVPPGKLPLDVGVVVQNIGTAASIYYAVAKGEVQTTAALTVTGNGIKEPKNLLVRLGTPIQEVLDYCGGVTDDTVKIIVGGPMMGTTQHDLSAPVVKATSGILVLTKKDVLEAQETACVRCGKCVDVCPLNLVPTKLARFSEMERWEDAEEYGVTVCMECGSCAYGCPANIPLVQWIKLGKQKVISLQKERQTA